MNKDKYVEIEWIDIEAGDTWMLDSELNDWKAPVFVTRGWIAKETEDAVFIYGTFGIDHKTGVRTLGDVNRIIKSVIINTRDLDNE